MHVCGHTSVRLAECVCEAGVHVYVIMPVRGWLSVCVYVWSCQCDAGCVYVKLVLCAV